MEVKKNRSIDDEANCKSSDVLVVDKLSPLIQKISCGDVIFVRSPDNPTKTIRKCILGMEGIELVDPVNSDIALINGAFKFRGACNDVFSLTDEQAAKGVVTHSSGNHAAALSLAAKLRGIHAHIVIPKNAPACKIENVMCYGGNVIWSDPTMQSREKVAINVVNDIGATLIHPYNDDNVMRKNRRIEGEMLKVNDQGMNMHNQMF